jgi:hypothetical protein
MVTRPVFLHSIKAVGCFVAPWQLQGCERSEKLANSGGELAQNGTSFHKRVICRSDAIVSRPPRKGMCHELKFS